MALYFEPLGLFCFPADFDIICDTFEAPRSTPVTIFIVDETTDLAFSRDASLLLSSTRVLSQPLNAFSSVVKTSHDCSWQNDFQDFQ